MKIAIVHDYIKEYGGAERVLEALHEAFPEAPIYTSVFLPEFLGPHRLRFEQMDIRTSILQIIPFKQKLISPFRIISPFIFKQFDLSKYDVVIVSQTGAYFPNLIHKGKHTKLITYTHTPPRYLYGYATAREWKNNVILLVLGEIANHFLRMVDYNASKNVDQFVCNSEEVRARIQKFYRRDALVINPPVEVQKNSSLRKSAIKSRYYLAGGRLARAKGIAIIIDAFKHNKKPLKIFGKGFAGYEEVLREKAKSKKSQIEFVGEVTDEEKLRLMKGARAYVFAAYDEDFGITPVESMAMGTPVIAYRSGGVKETVVEGVTGLFYDKNTTEELNDAIQKIEQTKFDEKVLKKHAQKYSKEHFISKIKGVILHA